MLWYVCLNDKYLQRLDHICWCILYMPLIHHVASNGINANHSEVSADIYWMCQVGHTFRCLLNSHSTSPGQGL